MAYTLHNRAGTLASMIINSKNLFAWPMKDIDYKMVDGQLLYCTVHNIFSITLLPTYIDHM